MPLFYFKCLKCDQEYVRITKIEPKELKCKCGESLTRTPKPPMEPTVTETLDNGTQAKPVTRLKDIEEIVKERADKDTRERGKPIEII